MDLYQVGPRRTSQNGRPAKIGCVLVDDSDRYDWENDAPSAMVGATARMIRSIACNLGSSASFDWESQGRWRPSVSNRPCSPRNTAELNLDRFLDEALFSGKPLDSLQRWCRALPSRGCRSSFSYR